MPPRNTAESQGPKQEPAGSVLRTRLRPSPLIFCSGPHNVSHEPGTACGLRLHAMQPHPAIRPEAACRMFRESGDHGSSVPDLGFFDHNEPCAGLRSREPGPVPLCRSVPNWNTSSTRLTHRQSRLHCTIARKPGFCCSGHVRHASCCCPYVHGWLPARTKPTIRSET